MSFIDLAYRIAFHRAHHVLMFGGNLGERGLSGGMVRLPFRAEAARAILGHVAVALGAGIGYLVRKRLAGDGSPYPCLAVGFRHFLGEKGGKRGIFGHEIGNLIQERACLLGRGVFQKLFNLVCNHLAVTLQGAQKRP